MRHKLGISYTDLYNFVRYSKIQILANKYSGTSMYISEHMLLFRRPIVICCQVVCVQAVFVASNKSL